MNKKGFTLQEIVIVIVIIGVMSSFAIPRYQLTIERTRCAEGVGILNAIVNAQKIYLFENGVYSSTLSALDIEIPTPDNFNAMGDGNINNSTTNLAEITRSGTDRYTLRIDEDGDICCSSDPSSECANLGYAACS